tara:strand:+ start:11134 stop:11718 length:585 start_codon:yes stop_codon:yes gene_type:complete
LNSFAALEFPDVPEVTEVPDSVPHKEKKVSYKSEVSSSTMRTIVFFFLRNMHAVKAHNLEQWRLFKHGANTLETASETMNAALYIFWKLEDDFHRVLQEKQKKDKHPRTFFQHSDLLEYLKAAKGKSRSDSNALETSDLCERTCQILQHCFTGPLERQGMPWELGEPLAFLADQGLDLKHHERVWLYSVASLWV